jgi:hypothetical protein
MAVKKVLLMLVLMMLLTIPVSQDNMCDGDENCDNIAPNTDSANPEEVDDPAYGHSSLHKDLFPISLRELCATVLLGALIMITNAAGIGGGGAILPIIMIFNFKVNVAVALCNVVICVGAVTRFAMEFNETHPYKKAKVIDYGIVVLMLPAIMLGSFLGVQVNIVVPQVVILTLLGVVLCFVSYRSTVKGIQLYKEEQLELKHHPGLLENISFSDSSKS